MGLSVKEKQKVKYGLLLLKSQDKVSTRFVKHIFRVFFIFDDGNVVVLFNGFYKKTQKTPENEIELAIKIKESYYADKRSSD